MSVRLLSGHRGFFCTRCYSMGRETQTKRSDLDSMCRDCLRTIESKENDVKILVLLILLNLRSKQK